MNKKLLDLLAKLESFEENNDFVALSLTTAMALRGGYDPPNPTCNTGCSGNEGCSGNSTCKGNEGCSNNTTCNGSC